MLKNNHPEMDNTELCNAKDAKKRNEVKKKLGQMRREADAEVHKIITGKEYNANQAQSSANWQPGIQWNFQRAVERGRSG